MNNTPTPGLVVIPPGGMKPKSKPMPIAVFFQIVVIVFGVPAVILGGSCVYVIATFVRSDWGDASGPALFGILMMPYAVGAIGILTLGIGLMAWQGSRPLRWVCIVISVLALSIPILAKLAEQRIDAAEKRREDEFVANVRAEQRQRRAEDQRRLDERRFAGPPRRLTDQQKLSLVRELGNLKGHKVKIACDLDNQESTRFATDLVEVFRQAGWVSLDGEELQLVRSADVKNVPYVYILESDATIGFPPPDYGAITFALSHAGLRVGGGRAPGLSLGQVEVRIGTNWLYHPATNGP
jgi:hypothetical protein